MTGQAEPLSRIVFNRGLAAVALVVTSPLFVLAIVLIKVFSPGPSFFVQDRIGRKGWPFRIYKFRTMKLGAAKGETGSVTIRDDPRVFRGARLLRKLKIDELPQLWNVLNGTMALVGPRPTVLDDYRRMDERQRRRWDVLPGITGLAQIHGSTSLTWPERIEYDLQYIRQQSFRLDLQILVKTVLLVITVQADTHPAGTDEWSRPAPNAAEGNSGQPIGAAGEKGAPSNHRGRAA